MNVEFRRASPEDARLLAETRRRAWDTTYRGIYPDAMIDEYDLEAHTARDKVTKISFAKSEAKRS